MYDYGYYRMSITQLLNVTRPESTEECQASYTAEAFEHQLSIMKEVHEKIGKIVVRKLT
jgi:hypothetical protein